MAGLCFILPAFFVMLALSAAYAAFSTLSAMRDAFYGVGPVLGIFAAAVYRLGRQVSKNSAVIIAVTTALAILVSQLGVAVICSPRDASVWRCSIPGEEA